jgi:TetR/AcrR family transcriptional repressor of mexJK operon
MVLTRFIMSASAKEGKKIRRETDELSARPRPGRPTRAQQAQRHEELLNAALDIFLDRGFDRATMEDIASCVSMSKRTLYARYDDKAALFRAAVRRAIDRYTISSETLDALDTGNLEDTLKAVARLRIANVATPIVTKLQRILTAQSYQFPEIAIEALDRGAGPTIDFLSALFLRHQATGEIVVEEPRRAALAFLSLVVGGPARMIVMGKIPADEEVEERTRFAVGLFLNGVRAR